MQILRRVGWASSYLCASIVILLAQSGSSAQPAATPSFDAPALQDVQPLVVAGTGLGAGTVRVITTERALVAGQPWGPRFNGGVRVATGDINGDGVVDLVAGTGPSGGRVRVFSGVDAAPLMDLAPFGAEYRGGVYVAAGDVNGDGRDDVIVGGEMGIARVLSGVDGADLGTGAPFGPGYAAGVTVAAGDVTGDGRVDVITGTAVGGFVRVFDGVNYSPVASGFPYGSIYAGGVAVAAGDFDGDARADVAVAPLNGSAPAHVFSGADLRVLGSAPPFPGASGMTVAVADVNDDGQMDLIVGAGPGSPPHVKAFSGSDGAELISAYAFEPTFHGGVFVAGLARAGVRVTTADTAAFRVGSPDSFTVRTAGGSGLVLSVMGTLPGGIAFTDHGDGTGTLAGTPSAGTAGSHIFQLQATRGGSVLATQDFTLDIHETPAITSLASTTFTEEQAGSFVVTTTGFPAATLSVAGALPADVTFVDQGDGTGRLSGTPAPTTVGTYPLTITATNAAGTTSQTFTLFVSGTIPIFTSPDSTTFAVGTPGLFTVTASSSPPVTSITHTGSLPTGVTFTDNGNGTATLAGTPAGGTAGTYSLTFTATNGVGSVPQTFTLNVQEAPAITSAPATAFTISTPGNFTVTATGLPVPSITQTGTLPAGVTFVDNGDGTATLAGTPTMSGTFPLTFAAQNGVGTAATQNFTLVVQAAGVFTSAASTTFFVGSPGLFVVTTSGVPPVDSLTLTGGVLPAGVVFTPGGSSATLSGIPLAGTGGIYPLVFTATNGVGSPATQSFTLTINEAPSFTTAPAATFAVDVAGSFTIDTLGFPVASIAIGGDPLPAGLAFVDNGDGSATLSGTAAPGTTGIYDVTFTATNGIGAPVVQSFTLTVAGIAFTSANTTTFVVGSPATFTIATDGTPLVTSIARSGSPLPAGVTYVDNLDGTATLAGTPQPGTGGSYAFTLTASNGVVTVPQTFTLLVNQAPAITSGVSATFTVGAPASFTVTTTGFPAPGLTVSGTLPGGVSFVDHGNGTGTLGGTPAAAAGGVYPLTITAANGVGASALQAFTLTVNEAPTITSANSAAFQVGEAGTFTITTTGFPGNAAITLGGDTLPAGVTFTDLGNGTATLAGTPGPGTSGVRNLTVTATNGVAPAAVQAFTLTVNETPQITSLANTTFTVGQPGTFTVTTTGFPQPSVALTGTLPPGVTFTPATGILAGTPAAGSQNGSPYALQVTASNGILPDAVQAFTLNVVCPVITLTPAGPALPDGLFNQAYSQAITASGGTGPYTFAITAGAAPPGIALSSTGVLSGTPTNTGIFNITVTATDSVSCAGSTAYTLTVRPNVQDDTYSGGVGNVEMLVGVAAGSTPAVVLTGTVLDNDQGPALSITSPSPVTTANGGQVFLNPNGSFVYRPQAGDTGNDSFTYTVSSNGVTNTGTVTLGVTGLVWFVRAGAPGGGDGRSHAPFATLDAAAAPSASGSTIYVHAGTGTTTGSLMLDPTQVLHGEGLLFTMNSLTIPAGTPPTLSGTVTLANNTAVQGLNFSGASPAIAASSVTFTLPTAITQVNVVGGTSALSLTNVTATAPGAITVSNATFTNTTAAEILISGGNVPVTIAPTVSISSNAGRSIDIQNRTGGTVTINAPITDTGQGIFLNGNSGSTIAFTGGLNLSTGANAAFTATGGGTVTATQNNTTIVNTIATTTGVGLNVTNTTIGAAGLTFRSVSVNGAANGIVLNTTGSLGGLTVTGNGGTCTSAATCTGGSIQNTTGVGILLTSTSNLSLTRVHVQDALDDGIRGLSVNNLALTSCFLTGNGNDTAENGLQLGEASGAVVGISGTLTITNTTISASAGNNVHIRNTSGTLASMSITGSSFNDLDDTTGANSFLFEMSGTAVTTAATISGSTFANNSPQRALEVQVHETGTIADFAVTGTTFDENGIHASFTQDTTANMTFALLNNTMTFANPLHAINVFSSSTSTGGSIRGTIQGNTIGNAAVANSGALGNAIRAFIQGRTAATLLIDNNTIRQVTGGARGMDLQFLGPIAPGQGVTQSDATITNNDVDTQAPASTFPLAAIYLAADDQGSPARVRANITGNSAQNSVGGGSFDYPTFDGIGAHLIFVDVGGAAEGQLVNTTGAADATAQLTIANPAAASVYQQDIGLIPGPITTP